MPQDEQQQQQAEEEQSGAGGWEWTARDRAKLEADMPGLIRAVEQLLKLSREEKEEDAMDQLA